MKMRQSLAEWEQAFVKEISLDRRRATRCGAPPSSARPSAKLQRRKKRGSLRFLVLVLTLILTAVVVTVVMFRTLYLLLG